jgi:hypothetical protein
MPPAPAPAPKPHPDPDSEPVARPGEHDYDDVVRLQGRGVVYRDGERLGETGYDLMVIPPDHQRPTLEPGTPPVDRADITGYLTDRFFIGEDVRGSGALTLVIEDGRRLQFRILEPDTNEIIGLGDLRP